MSAFIITSIDATVPTSATAQVAVFYRDHNGARGVTVFPHVFNSLTTTNEQLIDAVTALANTAMNNDLNSMPLSGLVGMTFLL